MGRGVVASEKVPLPRLVMKFIVMHVPWPKGSPTLKRWVRLQAKHLNHHLTRFGV